MKQILLVLFLLISINAFPQTGQYIKDSKTGCMIWSYEYSLGAGISWTGDCKNNYAEGNGTLLCYEDGKLAAEYTGQMKGGKFNGKGKYSIFGLGVMEGDFTDGLLNGKGAIYFDNGGKTIGNFVNGDFLNLDDNYLAVLKKEYLTLKDSTEIYINGNGSDMFFYYALVPDKEINAVLILLPSAGETSENVISCNKELMQKAYDNGILTAVISCNNNKSLESDMRAMNFFEIVFEKLVTKFSAPKDKFILSGLSLGGENALLYTEMSRNKKYNTYIYPLAVIGADPPVDNVTLYHHAKYEIDLYAKDTTKITDSKQMALNEDNFIIKYYHDLYGGPPEEFPDKYSASSVFSLNRDDGGNAKFLIDVPVRIYSDPDVVWQLKNKSRDFYHMNAADQSAMINFLMLKGNKNAEFVQALGKGYRVDGTRHPHSWSIVDPAGCIEWILKLAK
ncbi:MAG: hypothetical protein PHN88_01515 [Ignavibacteria bacterium]|nr:hypothetical protein [Ignavibacteria bacterium]